MISAYFLSGFCRAWLLAAERRRRGRIFGAFGLQRKRMKIRGLDRGCV
jgi:hypothetical protein